jgi:hypothetical protein
MNFVIYVQEIASMPEANVRGWIEEHTDTPCGRGNTLITPDPQRAKRFETNAQAFEFWRQQSKAVPLRPDGKPNRPLTAYTVEILPFGAEPHA